MVTKGYKVSGPGWKKAVQKSVAEKKNIAAVTEVDNHGNLVRVGYCFLSRETGARISPEIWFEEGEVTIEPIEGSGQKPNSGVMDIKFKHPKPNERHININILIGKNDFRIRGVVRILPDNNKTFVIMFDHQVLKNNKREWQRVVRYDCAHGFIHKDILGQKAKIKVPLKTKSKKKAIKIALKELLKDLKAWAVRAGFKDLYENEAAGFKVLKAIKKAEIKLIKILEEDITFQQEESSSTHFSRETERLVIRMDYPYIWMRDNPEYWK